jgi:hypothetical protein
VNVGYMWYRGVVNVSYNIFHLWHGQLFKVLHFLCQKMNFLTRGPLTFLCPGRFESLLNPTDLRKNVFKCIDGGNESY